MEHSNIIVDWMWLSVLSRLHSSRLAILLALRPPLVLVASLQRRLRRLGAEPQCWRLPPLRVHCGDALLLYCPSDGAAPPSAVDRGELAPLWGMRFDVVLQVSD
eukprot:SAG11_NODE_4735_length_1787_cov_1.344194_3_plen_104_part_00